MKKILKLEKPKNYILLETKNEKLSEIKMDDLPDGTTYFNIMGDKNNVLILHRRA